MRSVLVASMAMTLSTGALADATIVKSDVPPPPSFEWAAPRPAEWALLGLTVGLIGVDVAQTRAFLRRGEPETNPLLGTHPSELRLYLTAGLGTLALGTLWYILPPPWRSIALVPVIGLECWAIAVNF